MSELEWAANQLLIVVIIGLATYRMGAAMIVDKIAYPFQQWVDSFGYTEKGEDRSFWRGKFADLMTCIRCLPFWVGVGQYVVWVNDWPYCRHVIMVFAIAGVTNYVITRPNA